MLGEGLGQVLFHVELVAAALGDDVDDRLARGFARVRGILVGVDVNALVGIGEFGTLRQGQTGFGEDGHAGQGRGAGSETEK